MADRLTSSMAVMHWSNMRKWAVPLLLIINKINNMFFARVITKDTPFTYNQEALSESVGDVISISNITLAPSSKESASVFFKKEGDEFLICCLTHKNPHVPVNLYIEFGQNLEILVKGNGIVHVIGFFEPQPKIEHLDEIELHHKHECQQTHHDEPHHGEPVEQKAPLQSDNPVKSSPKTQKKQVKSPQVKPAEKTFSLEQQVESAEIDDDDESEEDNESEEISLSEENDLVGLNDLDDDIGEEQPRKQKVSDGKNKQNSQSFNGKSKVSQSSNSQPQFQNQKNQRKDKNFENRKDNGTRKEEKQNKKSDDGEVKKKNKHNKQRK